MERLGTGLALLVFAGPVSVSAQEREPTGEIGVSEGTVAEDTSDDSVEPEDDAWRDEAIKSYEQRALFSSGDSDWIPPRQGTSVEPLGRATFYEVVGQTEHASDYRLKRGLRYSIVGVGSAVAVASLIYGLSEGSGEIGSDGAAEEEDSDRLMVGLAGVLVGAGIAFSSALIGAHPVSVAERRSYERKYNEALLEELGLFPGEVQWLHDERALRERAASESGPELSVGPLLGRERSRGVSLMVSF